MARVASFGNAHGRKKSFKINKMPRMARMAGQKWQGRGLAGAWIGREGEGEGKKQVKRCVTEM